MSNAKNYNQSVLEDLDNLEKLFNPDIATTDKADDKPQKEPEKTKSKTKAQTTKQSKQQTKQQTSQQIDKKVVQRILKDLPDPVKTRDLNQVFQFNDGGKYLRRHLRAKFSAGHEYGSAWVWKKDDKQLIEIIEYFVLHLTPERREQLACVGEDPVQEV